MLYASPYFNDPTFYQGGLGSQLNYMRNNAQSNLNSAQAQYSQTESPQAAWAVQAAQSQAQFYNGLNPNNAQDIRWGNGPLAGGGGGFSSGASGGLSGGGAGSAVGGNVSQSMTPDTGWGTGNNGAPSQGVGYNSTGAQMNYFGGYNGAYSPAVANIYGNGNYDGTGSSQIPSRSLSDAGNPYGGQAVMGPNGWQMDNGMPLGGNGGPAGNYIPATQSNPYGQTPYGQPDASGMMGTYGAMGSSAGASGSGSGGGYAGGYRQMDPSGLLQGQVDGQMGYGTNTSIPNYNFNQSAQNFFNDSMFGGGSGGGDDD